VSTLLRAYRPCSSAWDLAIRRVIYCAGQTAVDANGSPMHRGDMAKQINQALDNLEAVLKQAGLSWANVVRLNLCLAKTRPARKLLISQL
jgi:enamine deaminase RidA (YjgF/YER057c/UK114 family)